LGQGHGAGPINKKLKGENVLLAGPGRWGTTTPSLGVLLSNSQEIGQSCGKYTEIYFLKLSHFYNTNR